MLLCGCEPPVIEIACGAKVVVGWSFAPYIPMPWPVASAWFVGSFSEALRVETENACL